MENPKKILIIDDESVICLSMSAQLSRAGFSTATAYNGTEGLKKALSMRPDVVLLDISMPGLSGYEVCSELRKSRNAHDVVIIMFTSLVEESERIKAFKAGANDYVPKNIPLHKLCARISAQLRMDRVSKIFYSQMKPEKKEHTYFPFRLDYLFPWVQNIIMQIQHYSKSNSAVVIASGAGELGIFSFERQEPVHDVDGFRSDLVALAEAAEKISNTMYFRSGNDFSLHPHLQKLPLLKKVQEQIGEVRNCLIFQSDGINLAVFNHAPQFDVHVAYWIWFQFSVVRRFLKNLLTARLTPDKKDHILSLSRTIVETIDASPGKFSRMNTLINWLARKSGCCTLNEEEMTALPLCDAGRLFVDGEKINYSGFSHAEEKAFLLRSLSETTRYVVHLYTDDPVCQTIAKYQFERYDGSGPLQVPGKRIPEIARIYRLVSAYDALRRPRPYREAPCTHKEAMDTLTEEADQFDSQLLHILRSDPSIAEDIYIKLGDIP